MIRWITDQLGTAPADEVIGKPGLNPIDVRDLVDKSGNPVEAVKEKITQALVSLRSGQRTVICCDYGISRSNAVAAGVLTLYQPMPFLDAVRMVQDKTGEMGIKLEPLSVVQQALGQENPAITGLQRTRKVLVTGGSGFIGTQLCERLRTSADIIVPLRDTLDILRGSTQLSLLAAEHEVGTIIHLASPRVYTSNLALGQTLSMLRNVLDVCSIQRIRLIYLSSWEVFSGYSGDLLVNESIGAMPKGPYGEAKHLAEEMIRIFQRTAHLDCALVRSSPVYGSTSDRPKFIHNFIGKAYRNEDIATHRYLNGDAALDLLHIDDLIDGIIRIFDQGFSGLVHLGTGKTISTCQIAEFIKREIGGTGGLSRVLIQSHVARIAIDNSLAQSTLGWHPSVDIWNGLRQLLTISN